MTLNTYPAFFLSLLQLCKYIIFKLLIVCFHHLIVFALTKLIDKFITTNAFLHCQELLLKCSLEQAVAGGTRQTQQWRSVNDMHRLLRYVPSWSPTSIWIWAHKWFSEHSRSFSSGFGKLLKHFLPMFFLSDFPELFKFFPFFTFFPFMFLFFLFIPFLLFLFFLNLVTSFWIWEYFLNSCNFFELARIFWIWEYLFNSCTFFELVRIF